MSLYHLPYRRESGPENMATDWWMLSQASQWSGPIFRRYGWDRPQITFGYGQKASWVESETRKPLQNMTRRPTGGGIVRHGNDLTYGLVLPVGSLGAEMPPMEFYGKIHQRWGEALIEQGVANSLMPCPEKSKGGIPGDCFREPVGRDLMDEMGTQKLAGAAMKRTRNGVLVQGTLDLGKWPDLNHLQIEIKFLELIARDLAEKIVVEDWPEELELQRLEQVKTFSSVEWTRDRKRV